MAVFCLLSFFALAIRAPSQETGDTSTPNFKTLANFDGTDGAHPRYGALIQGLDANIYGTADEGGIGANSHCSLSYGCGTVFKSTAEGALTALNSFDFADGWTPSGSLVQASNGNFYGTTQFGGASDTGTVFEISPEGKLTTLYSFCAKKNCADGRAVYGGLVQGGDGDFYGTTYAGGAGNNCGTGTGCGTVFKITAGGELTTLHSFCIEKNCPDGASPLAGLALGIDGNFYGTTQFGGAATGTVAPCGEFGCGTAFKITPEGKLTTLHSFDYTDGYSPEALLLQATDGDFYGTTPMGGEFGAGTVFKITPEGELTTLHSFCTQVNNEENCTDGNDSTAGLVQATDGDFYGTTTAGGAHGYGSIFKITPEGALTTLHSFCAGLNVEGSCIDGSAPSAALIQATNGTLYGTTSTGGAHGDGTIFSLSVGLGPFVVTRPSSGAPGTTVEILGNNLMDIMSVTFNGTAAAFKVVSCSEITATVPADATTGKVEVKTRSGTLASNIAFLVTP